MIIRFIRTTLAVAGVFLPLFMFVGTWDWRWLATTLIVAIALPGVAAAAKPPVQVWLGLAVVGLLGALDALIWTGDFRWLVAALLWPFLCAGVDIAVELSREQA